MKLLLSLISSLLLALSTQAQHKDSLKTFRKLTKKYQKQSDYVFIPSGSYSRGVSDSDLPYVDYFRSSVFQLDSFFMQKYEVSNAQYLAFIKDISDTNSQLGRKYLPDTMVWRTPLAFGEKYVDYYLRHPAYGNYPVVGVSYRKAVAFAKWKTEQYNQQEERIFKKVRFRLPTEEEWEYAAKGGKSYGYTPFKEPNAIDEKGEPRANFVVVSQLGIYRDTFPDTNNRFVRSISEKPKEKMYLISTGDRYYPKSARVRGLYEEHFIKPVESYEPNGYGLYQMGGNVEEMVDAYYYRDPSFYYFSHDIKEYKYDKPWGVTKGGSWGDTGFYLQCPVRQFYEDEHSSSMEMGFRLVMEVLEF